MAAPADLVDYLASKGYVGKQATGGEWTFPCPACGEGADSRKRKMYVNREKGVTDCKVCGTSGGINDLRAQFGDPPLAASAASDDFAATSVEHGVRDALEAATAFGQKGLAANDNVMLHLINERGLTAATIKDKRLGYVGTGWSLARETGANREVLSASGLVVIDGHRAGKDTFTNHLLIPYLRGKRVVQMRGRAWAPDARVKYLTGAGQSALAYNVDSLVGATEAIVVEGEFDCIVLEQALKASGNDRLTKMAVLGIPGAATIPSGFSDLFDRCKRVYIAFDPDPAGEKGAAKLAAALGTKARIVEMPTLPDPKDASKREPDWTDLFVKHGWTGAEVLALLTKVTGTRIRSVSQVAAEYREFKAITTGLKTGWVMLDHVIDPGFQPGQVVIALAKTGTGKTIWLCNLMWNTRHEPTLLFSMEQTNIEMWERLKRIALFHYPTATDAELEAMFSHLWMVDDNRMSSEDLAMMIDEFEAEVGVKPTLLLVDYLGYYARGQPGGGPYEKVSNAAMQLKAEAKRHKLVVVAPHQVSRGGAVGQALELDNARDSGVVEETGDFVFSIFKPDDAKGRDPDAKPTHALVMEILKSRHGGKGQTVPLQMDMLTLAIVDRYAPAADRARQHNELLWNGGTYEQLREQQTRKTQTQMEVSK